MNNPYQGQNHREIMPTKISPCLWFDHQAEDAARFYTAIFKDSKIVAISRYPEAGKEIHGKPAGSVLTVAFELNGQSFTALNGGPIFKFNEAVSFQIECATQAYRAFAAFFGFTAFFASVGPCRRASGVASGLPCGPL